MSNTTPFGWDDGIAKYGKIEYDPVEQFWKDFYTRMVPRKNILGEHGVKYYLDRDTSLSDEQKKQIIADAQKIMNGATNAKPYFYEGGKRKTRRHSKKQKKTRRRLRR